MGFDEYGVHCSRFDGEEHFVIIFRAEGRIVKDLEFDTEADLRSALKEMGLPEHRIAHLIHQAQRADEEERADEERRLGLLGRITGASVRVFPKS